MKRSIVTIYLALVLTALLALPATAGRPSHAGGGGGGGGSRGFSGGGGSSFSRTMPSAGRSAFPSTRGGASGHDWSAERRTAVQDRNQQQRLDRAEYLRGISERNGNTRLGETATRMEERAYAQPVPREQAHPNPYQHLAAPQGQRPPQAQQARLAPALPPQAKKLTWRERVRSWMPW